MSESDAYRLDVLSSSDIQREIQTWKLPLTLSNKIYLLCIYYEKPLRMEMITFALTLITMYLLMGFIHNPFLLFGLSFVIAFVIVFLVYTPVLAMVIILAFPIIVGLILLALVILFVLGWMGIL